MLKSEWLTRDERQNLKLNSMDDEQLKSEFGFSEYSIEQIRKSARRIKEISSEFVNGLRVPSHRSMYVMHAQAHESRDYHYLIDRETGQIITKVYVSRGAWVENQPENSYELALGMSDIPERPTYRDLLESFIDQMRGQGAAREEERIAEEVEEVA
ncbi:MAG: hypothetical protein WC343_15305 [Bacilli bacterium]|jgi:hypothetical protein